MLLCVIPFSFDYIPKNRNKYFKEYIFFPFAFFMSVWYV